MVLITKIRNSGHVILTTIRLFFLRNVYHMDISKSARISFWAMLDKTYPKGIHIGDESFVASGAMIFTHDYCRGLHEDTRIGKRCFIGARSIIMPGISIGDEVIVGAGSIVTKDVKSHCIIAGNPAEIIKQNIHTGKFGIIKHEFSMNETGDTSL
jgi:acetyltransferase-like isoleucine patch superfamily enzyme